MRAHTGRMLAAVLLCLVAATCKSPAPTALRSQATTTTTVAVSATTTTETPAVSTSLVTTTAPVVVTTTEAPTAPNAVDGLDQVGAARQAIVVRAESYGATTATFTAYERGAGGWQEAFGPWTARIGYNGLAPPGAKREGDGRTPSGTYAFDFMFGVSADPGVRFQYRRVTTSIVWDDDPQSALYNQWVDRNQQDPGADPEEMYQPQAYAHGAVIAYNASATPGLGSAIFLHASTGGATAGCVSLPLSQLVEVLRWLDPAASPRIVMGVG